MIRVFGLCCIAASFSLCGFFLADREDLRPKTMFAFADLLEYIRFEMNRFLPQKNALLSRFENPFLEKCGFLAELRARTAAGEEQPLCRTLEAQKAKLVLDPESYRVLYEYAYALGRGELSEELERAKKTQAFLENRASKLSEQAKKRTRLFRAAGLLIGAYAFLLFC